MAPSALSSNVSPFSPLLLIRDVQGDVNGVKSTFSSWDNCMQKDYCKYPVIVIIVIGSLIALSILLCVVRCCCCGMECCCAACSCMNACCPSPRGGRRDRSRYRDSAPPPRQGYQPTPGPFYAAPTAPQFATFDSSRKVHADTLPAMPSWDTSTSKKVYDESHPEDMEMNKMDQQHDETKPMLAHAASPQMGTTAYGQHGAMLYTDGVGAMGGPYGQNAYGGGLPVAGAAMAGGALGQRQQAGLVQGYRSPSGQRPGMGPSQDSYGSQVMGVQGYQNAGNRPGMSPQQNSYGSSAMGGQSYSQNVPQQQGFVGAAYGQQRPQANQNTSYNQNTGNSAYGYAQSPPNNQTGYNGNSSGALNQNNYTNTHPTQRHDSSNFAPAQSQSFGSGPSPPQPTYGGGQHEYTRSVGQTPQSLAPGYRGNNNFSGGAQQAYQPYQSGHHQGQSQGQEQWRDV